MGLKSVLRLDGFRNFLSRVGGSADKAATNEVSAGRIVSDIELTGIWISTGMGKKIVSIRAEDALSEGIEFPNDKDGKFQEELKRLKVFPKVRQALAWADLFGGAVLLPMVDNNEVDLSKPLADRAGSAVFDLRVYDRTRIWDVSTMLVTEPTSPFFEDVEVMKIRKLTGEASFDVHVSRLLILKGEPIPHNSYTGNVNLRWWGMSMLQPIFDTLSANGISFQAVAHLMQECSIAKFKIPGLSDSLMEPDGESRLMNKMELMSIGKSVVRSVFMDEGEDYIRENIPIGDIASALPIIREQLCAETGFPMTKLYGTAPGGLNASGESDQENHNKRIRAYQMEYVGPVLEDLFKRIARGLGLSEEIAKFEFKPLGAPSQAQLIDMRAKQATTDKTYHDMNVLDSDEIRENRFYQRASLETVVKTSAAPEPEEVEIEGAEGEPKPGAKKAPAPLKKK